MHLSSLCSLYSPCTYDIIVVINLCFPECCYGVCCPLFPVLSTPSWLRQMATLPGSGSDEGFFLLKGSFFFPQSPRARSGREIGSKRSFSAICSLSYSSFFLLIKIHPSIFYTRLIRRSGCGGAGAYPGGHWARGGVHPGQVASPSQGHTETNETNNHTHSHTHS